MQLAPHGRFNLLTAVLSVLCSCIRAAVNIARYLTGATHPSTFNIAFGQRTGLAAPAGRAKFITILCRHVIKEYINYPVGSAQR